MKYFLSGVLSLLLVQCTAQYDSTTTPINRENDEFPIYDNGLIYSEITMSKLGKVVDSLNIRFKRCEPKTYRSLEQGFGTYLLVTKNLKRARKAIAQNITLEDFIKRFRIDEVKPDQWVVKERTEYEVKKILYESHGDDPKYIYVPDGPQNDKQEGWVFEDHGDEMEVFYLHKLNSNIIPVEYARLIQYVDCLIDTTSTIFTNEERPDSLTYRLAPKSKVRKFIDLAMDFDAEPKTPEIDRNDPRMEQVLKQYDVDVENWDMGRIAVLDKKMQAPDNVTLLNEAVRESITNQNGFFIDYYAQRYLPGSIALELKRSFRVHGFCSADTGPRDHAKAICLLAAENYQWDIFLRAHLDILNDNFLRSSDGVYAWGARETYIKELEDLKINAVDLLIGTILSSKDLNENHYRADRYRTGRALTESKFKGEAVNLLLRMIQDEQLDLYNRMEMGFALLFYTRHLKSQDAYRSNLERIKMAIETLPKGIRLGYANLIDL